MTHLCNFSYGRVKEEDVLKRIKKVVQEIEADAASEFEGCGDPECSVCDQRKIPWKDFGHAFEVVLIDGQMKEFGPMLKKIGFQYVFRWMNNNSGNFCNLLVYKSSEEDEEKAPPFDWSKM